MTESLFPARSVPSRYQVGTDRCEKCGGADILSRWHGAGADHYTRHHQDCRTYGRLNGKPAEEHLHYHCRTCQFDWTGPLTPPEPRRWDVRLVGAAAHPCVYDSDNQPPECPLEWPGEPWKWCGSCLARAVTAE